MKLDIKLSGGFADLPEQVVESLDTSQLDPIGRRRVEERVQRLNFFQLPADLPETEVAADWFTYSVTAKDGQRNHTVRYKAKEAASGPLKGLVAEITNSKLQQDKKA